MSAGYAYTAAVCTPQGEEEIAFLRYGQADGHRVIAWHGITSANRFWYWDVFWQQAQVTLAGLPGHGPVRRYDPAHYERWTPQHLIDVGIATVRQQYQGQPLTLIGHSTGGLIALGVALQAPELVARLILLNPVVWRDLSGIVRLWLAASSRPALARIVIGATFSPTQRSFRLFRTALQAYMSSPATFYANPRCDSTLHAGYTDYCATGVAAVAATARVLEAADLRPDVRRQQPAIPTLIVHGAQDGIVPLDQAKWLAAHLPNAELYAVPGAGHLCFAEREDLVNRRVTQWLAANPV
jgi:pimeloyl-ACP methyl ester carboxylesterase